MGLFKKKKVSNPHIVQEIVGDTAKTDGSKNDKRSKRGQKYYSGVFDK